MTKPIAIAALCAGLALPGIVSAQMGGQGPMEPAAPMGHPYSHVSVRGTVEHVDPAEGEVTIRSGARRVVVHGLPVQLTGIGPGDAVELPYETYGETRWIPLGFGRGFVQMREMDSQQRSFTGAIQDVGRSRGDVTIRGIAFRIHPALLMQLQRGQRITVRYARFGETLWITAVLLEGRRERPEHASRPAVAGAERASSSRQVGS